MEYWFVGESFGSFRDVLAAFLAGVGRWGSETGALLRGRGPLSSG